MEVLLLISNLHHLLKYHHGVHHQFQRSVEDLRAYCASFDENSRVLLDRVIMVDREFNHTGFFGLYCVGARYSSVCSISLVVRKAG